MANGLDVVNGYINRVILKNSSTAQAWYISKNTGGNQRANLMTAEAWHGNLNLGGNQIGNRKT